MNAAPWSAAVKASSALACVLLLVLAFGLPHAVLPVGHRALAEGLRGLVFVLPFVILGASALFVVRGYEVHGRDLFVRRLLWATRIPLEGLEAAWRDPEAMARSVRVFGNAGLFAVTGVYRNRTLGTYRAFVTDRKLAVVLRTRAQKSIVLSPERPEAFLATLRARFPGLADRPSR
jgi:PH (Pleckstrin Homology) domain-containing protein